MRAMTGDTGNTGEDDRIRPRIARIARFTDYTDCPYCPFVHPSLPVQLLEERLAGLADLYVVGVQLQRPVEAAHRLERPE